MRARAHDSVFAERYRFSYNFNSEYVGFIEAVPLTPTWGRMEPHYYHEYQPGGLRVEGPLDKDYYYYFSSRRIVKR